MTNDHLKIRCPMKEGIKKPCCSGKPVDIFDCGCTRCVYWQQADLRDPFHSTIDFQESNSQSYLDIIGSEGYSGFDSHADVKKNTEEKYRKNTEKTHTKITQEKCMENTHIDHTDNCTFAISEI
jgi:hypothetical protein